MMGPVDTLTAKSIGMNFGEWLKEMAQWQKIEYVLEKRHGKKVNGFETPLQHSQRKDNPLLG